MSQPSLSLSPAEDASATLPGLGAASSSEARTARDKLVGGGFAALAVAYVVSTVAAVIGLVSTIDADATGRALVTSVLSAVGEATSVVAFAVAAMAVLGARHARSAKLMTAGAIATFAFLAGFVAYGLNVITDLDADLSWKGTVSDALAAGWYLSLAVASGIATATFAAAARSATGDADGRRLAVASGIAVAAFVVSAAGNLVTGLFYDEIKFTGLMVNALYVATAGALITAVAAVVVMRAFGAGSRGARDGGLGTGIAIFAAGNALVAVANVMLAVSAKDNGYTGSDITQTWLTTAAWVGIVAALAVMAAGFMRSRRADG